MPKVTGVEQHNKARVNPALNIHFAHGTSVSRSPFFGMDIKAPEKTKAVMSGMPDGRSGYPISRER